jgi:NADH-quinone oxidoreductase subunit N
MINGFDLAALAPELILAIAGLALLLLGVFRDEEEGSVVTPLAVITLVMAGIVALVLDRTRTEVFGGHFVFDGFAGFLKLMIFLSAAASLLVAPGYMRDERVERFEYPVLALFSCLGFAMMVSANSLVALYMALELGSLPLYVMAAINRDSLRSTEAGLKYFVLGALASGMLLYGCSLIYGFTGSLMFGAIAEHLVGGDAAHLPLGALIGLVFVICGLAFKMAAVPFHMWTPDVYEGAPTPVTTFFTAAPKIAAMGLLIRVLMEPFGHFVAEWQQVIVVVSIASMALGSFAAIGQSNIKRMMAYSSIGHIGFALVGLAAGTERGVLGVLVYLAIYVTMTIGAFAGILFMRRQGRYVETIDDLAGLSRQQPLVAAAMGVFMFSLAGIPPLAGFFAKLYVFMAAIDAGLTGLAVIGVVTSVVGAYYYLRIVKVMYFDEAAEPFDELSYPGLSGVTAVTAVLVLLFIVIPGPIVTAAGAAAAALVR